MVLLAAIVLSARQATPDRICQLNRGDLVPILMITVLDDRESIEQAFAVGATDYITKPLHWEVLSHRVRRLLRAYQGMLEIEKVKQKLLNKQVWEQILRNTLHKLWQCPELSDSLSTILTDIQHLLKVERIVLFEKENKLFILYLQEGDSRLCRREEFLHL